MKRWIAAAAMLAGSALAQPAGDMRDLSVGLPAARLPTEGYFAFACGSNGGTPLEPIDDWSAFRQCAPDRATGLYEVYYEYDDEGDYTLRMLADVVGDGERVGMRQFYGTRVAGHPAVLSVLFDETGVAKAIRVVTDQRADVESRRNAYLLRVAIMNSYGHDGWTCIDIPRAEGETPVGQFSVKARCEKVVGTRRMIVEAHLYRKAGQTGFDRAGDALDGDFFSLGRWEIWGSAR